MKKKGYYEYDPDFNSIKVQLKHFPAAEELRKEIFQFHKGTIKTARHFISCSQNHISIP